MAQRLPKPAYPEAPSPPDTQASFAIEVAEPAGLEAFYRDDTLVARWRLTPRSSALQAAARIAAGTAVVGRVVEPGSRDLAGLLDGLSATELLPPLTEVVQVFADLADASRVGLRLAAGDQRTCPRFHVDQVGVRMVLTLHGPGTEWLVEGEVERRWLGPRERHLVDETCGLLRPGATVRQAAAWEAVFLKGTAWPGSPGVVHRSPALAPGQRRAFLTLDAL